ncbi:unnamed protein product [Gadus morhua 'NCC']
MCRKLSVSWKKVTSTQLQVMANPPPDNPDLQTPPPAAEHHIWTTEPSHSLADEHKQSQQPRRCNPRQRDLSQTQTSG